MALVADSVNRAEVVHSGEALNTREASSSGISWPAILGGALAAASLSLILLAFGSGFGLASVSPWSNSGVSATTFSIMTGIWLIVVQWASSGLGGYLAGRLRTKWVGVHTHEVFFRDTANGFLAWAVAAVLGAVALATAVASLLSGGANVAGSITSANEGMSAASPATYYVDSLFRADHPNSAMDQTVRTEATAIWLTGMRHGTVPDTDKIYLARLTVARTGLSEADARKRVDDVIAKAKADADAARKAGAYVSIFTGLSMLIGAFIAAAAAALGGQHRDEAWRAHQ
jgi:hypothetical protein